MKLKPCPFCGVRPKCVQKSLFMERRFLIKCKNEACLIKPQTLSTTRTGALRAWETRI